MKKIITTVFLSGIVLMAMPGCKKDAENLDVEKPVLTLTAPDDDTLIGGNTLAIRGTATDNKGLSQVKFEIHSDFDAHTHGKKSAVEFEWDTIINLSGTSADISIDLVLPEDLVSGPYHLLAMLLDLSGNEANLVDRDLVFVNGIDAELPTITNLTTLPVAVDGEVEINAGESIDIAATLSDNLALAKVELIIIRESDDKEMWEEDIEITGTAYNLNETVTFDSTWQAGDYGLLIIVIDSKGNRAKTEIHVHLD